MNLTALRVECLYVCLFLIYSLIQQTLGGYLLHSKFCALWVRIRNKRDTHGSQISLLVVLARLTSIN